MESKTYELLIDEINKVVFDNLKDTDMSPNLKLQKDLYLDSISFYTLIVNLEQVFQVRLNKASIDAPEFVSIESLTNYIDSLRKVDASEE